MKEPLTGLSDEEFESLRVGGLKVNYLVVCPRKLWLFSRGIRLEASSERVLLGKLLHERAYPDLPRKEVMIDDLIKIDVVGEKVLEVKYSRRLREAARLQLAYYLYYLKRLGAGELVGELRFPRERRREEVKLEPELEREVEEGLRRVREIEGLPQPPEAPFTSICRPCSYAELCWG